MWYLIGVALACPFSWLDHTLIILGFFGTAVHCRESDPIRLSIPADWRVQRDFRDWSGLFLLVCTVHMKPWLPFGIIGSWGIGLDCTSANSLLSFSWISSLPVICRGTKKNGSEKRDILELHWQITGDKLDQRWLRVLLMVVRIASGGTSPFLLLVRVLLVLLLPSCSPGWTSIHGTFCRDVWRNLVNICQIKSCGFTYSVDSLIVGYWPCCRSGDMLKVVSCLVIWK